MKAKLNLYMQIEKELERVRLLEIEKMALEEPKCEYPIPSKPAGP